MAAPSIVDGRFWPPMLMLRQCLCEALATHSPEAKLCWCAVIPGLPDLSGVVNGKGLAYVRFVGSQRSDGGVQATPSYDPCGEMLVATVEIGVYRCAPVAPPNKIVAGSAWEAVAEQQMSDHAAIQAALCCFRDRLADEGLDVPMMTGQSAAQGPEGGVVGLTYTMLMGQAL